MKTRIKNVALLDMRRTAPETFESLEGIENAAVILVSPQTRPMLSRIRIGNVAAVVEVPDGPELVIRNGKATLSADMVSGGAIFLLMNGELIIDSGVTPEQLAQYVAGGIINGKLVASKAQLGALTARGVAINGMASAYNDDLILRQSGGTLTKGEAQDMRASTYLLGRTRLEKGVCTILWDKDLSLYGEDAVLVEDADFDDFTTIWRGTGTVHRIPEGFTLMEGNQNIAALKARLLRGKRFILGDMILREDVTSDSLKGLEGLRITGTLFIAEHLLDTVLPLLDGEPELVPFTGALLMVDGSMTLSADADALPERLALHVDGELSLARELDPMALKERVSLLYVNGEVRMTQAQQMALLPVTIMHGHVDVLSAEEEAAGEAPAETDDPELNIIGNAATFVL